ncbi:MAG: methylamine dehydrogenase heavy chain [Halieaceae bacterium]|jgi:methylamine dehydrogenase heavy chain
MLCHQLYTTINNSALVQGSFLMLNSIGTPFRLFVFGVLAVVATTRVQAELPAEPIPKIETVSSEYPDSLIFVHDANFNALIAGRVVLVDVASDSRNYKGALDAAQFASFTESTINKELYVAETFYSRGTRGERTDVLTVYDRDHLKVIAELELPNQKRGMMVSNRYTLQLVDNDQILLVFNFTPAASVSVIDIAKREILSEVQIPGCSLIYPTGVRGFSSLCSNGSLITVQFDNDGKVLSQSRLPAFFNVDQDPLFAKPVYIDGTAYFPSFHGQIQPINLSSNEPSIEPAWSLLSTSDTEQNWRPGGWQIASVSDAGQIYLLMHPDGEDGSHKGGGSEVWVFDPKTKKRVARFELKEWGVSIEVTRGADPYLVVTNGDMQLDIYGASDGSWLKMIGGTAAMPFNLHALK